MKTYKLFIESLHFKHPIFDIDMYLSRMGKVLKIKYSSLISLNLML